MKCYVHPEADAVGTCVACGKFICAECNTEISGRNHCKSCVSKVVEESQKKIEKLEDNKQQTPMVFMNAGGASSSSSSSASGGHQTMVPIKSKLIAGLLAIFLGGFGIHKFYLGKFIQGFIYLLFCWTYIPSFIGLIEGIIYLCSSDHKFAMKYGARYI